MKNFKFKIGDKVRYIGYRTEYNIVAIGGNKDQEWACIKLTKIDPRRMTLRSRIGEIFDYVLLRRLEGIISKAAHPLTKIFKDYV